jgi:hypothetical protein
MSTLTLAYKKNASPVATPTRISPIRSFAMARNADSAPSNSSHQFNQLAVTNPSLSAQSCPLSIANPRACPTGGVCHLCPGKV